MKIDDAVVVGVDGGTFLSSSSTASSKTSDDGPRFVGLGGGDGGESRSSGMAFQFL